MKSIIIKDRIFMVIYNIVEIMFVQLRSLVMRQQQKLIE